MAFRNIEGTILDNFLILQDKNRINYILGINDANDVLRVSDNPLKIHFKVVGIISISWEIWSEADSVGHPFFNRNMDCATSVLETCSSSKAPIVTSVR